MIDMSMKVEALNGKLRGFFVTYTSDEKSAQEKLTLARECQKDIQQYYSQNAIERYKALSKGSFGFDQQLDIDYLLQQDVVLHTQVERFKEILDKQNEILTQLHARAMKLELSQNKTYGIIKKKQAIAKELEELQGEISLREEMCALKLDSKPFDAEELLLIHSIKGVFYGIEASEASEAEEVAAAAATAAVAFDKITNSEELIAEMNERLQKIETKLQNEEDGAVKEILQQRLGAMQNLKLYYTDYNKAKELKTEELYFPEIPKIKSITYDSPEQYNAGGFSMIVENGDEDYGFAMSKTQWIACPKKAMMHITFENDAKFSVIPGPKPKLFLPSKSNFEDETLEAVTAQEAYDASIRLLAKQYLQMNGGCLVDRITLNFNGLDPAEEEDIREKFIHALLDEKAEEVRGNRVIIDVEQAQIVEIATKSLFKNDKDCKVFWDNYHNPSNRLWREWLLRKSAKPPTVVQQNEHKAVIFDKALKIVHDKLEKSEVSIVPNIVFDSLEDNKAKKLAKKIMFLVENNETHKDYVANKKSVEKYLQAKYFGAKEGGQNNTKVEGELKKLIAGCRNKIEEAKSDKNFCRVRPG